jgi:hypothetical protein
MSFRKTEMRRMKSAATAILLLTLSPAVASAQINWGAIQQPDFAGSAFRAQEAGRAARAQREADEAAAALAEQQERYARAQADQAEQEQAARSALLQAREANMPAITAMIKAGDCKGAVLKAVSYNDWEAAALLNQHCRPAPAPQP